MFYCGECGGLTKPGEGARFHVAERRDKEYPAVNQDGTLQPMPDNGRRGWEISKEVKLCPACASKHTEDR